MKLSQLKGLFDPLVQVGHTSKVVKIEGIEIKIKTLTSKEEADVQKALSSLREDENVSTIEYVDLFRRETLSRSIIALNGVSLEEPLIETGETLENGVPVKVKREEALSEILGGLSRVVVTHLFQELALLSEAAEKKVSSNLESSEKKIEEERKNLEERLDTLNKTAEMDAAAESHANMRNVYSNAISEIG